MTDLQKMDLIKNKNKNYMPTSVSKIISYYKSFFDADKHSKKYQKYVPYWT